MALADNALHLAPSLFSTGFARYSVTGLNGLEVADGAQVDVAMPVYRFRDVAPNQASGVDPRAALESWTPPLFQENPAKGVLTQRGGASLALQAGSSDLALIDPASSPLSIGHGARISVDPGQRINLRGAGQITVDGQLHAWGGTLDIRQQQFGSLDVATRLQNADPQAHNRSIWIGEDAVLDVAGRAYTAVDALGRVYGQVGKGGSIILGGEIDSKKLTATSADAYVIVRDGARLDASGTHAVLDLAGLGMTDVATDGGRIALSSYNGVFLDGQLKAAAGGIGASGGRLEIVQDAPLYQMNLASNEVRAPREMIISQRADGSLLPADLQAGEGAAQLRYRQTRLSAERLMSAGFDHLSLMSNGLLTFADDVDLRMNQSLNVYAGSISLAQAASDTTRVNLAAPNMRLSGLGFYLSSDISMRPRVLATPTTQVSNARFTATADLLDLSNTLSFGAEGTLAQLGAPALAVVRRGFDQVTLDSRGDMRFLAPNDNERSSRLWTAGDLNLRAAQIYPATGVSADVRVGYQGPVPIAEDARTLRISGHGEAPQALPYSAFGSLLLVAGNIEQGGVIRAPLGLIQLGRTRWAKPGSCICCQGVSPRSAARGWSCPMAAPPTASTIATTANPWRCTESPALWMA